MPPSGALGAGPVVIPCQGSATAVMAVPAGLALAHLLPGANRALLYGRDSMKWRNWRRFRHSTTPVQWAPYWASTESPVSQ